MPKMFQLNELQQQSHLFNNVHVLSVICNDCDMSNENILKAHDHMWVNIVRI